MIKEFLLEILPKAVESPYTCEVLKSEISQPDFPSRFHAFPTSLVGYDVRQNEAMLMLQYLYLKFSRQTGEPKSYADLQKLDNRMLTISIAKECFKKSISLPLTRRMDEYQLRSLQKKISQDNKIMWKQECWPKVELNYNTAYLFYTELGNYCCREKRFKEAMFAYRSAWICCGVNGQELQEAQNGLKKAEKEITQQSYNPSKVCGFFDTRICCENNNDEDEDEDEDDNKISTTQTKQQCSNSRST